MSLEAKESLNNKGVAKDPCGKLTILIDKKRL